MMFMPELLIAVGALVTLGVSMFGSSTAVAVETALWFVVMSAAALLSSFHLTMEAGEPFFPGIYQVDAFSQLLKLGILVGAGLVLGGSGRLLSFRSNTRLDVAPFMLFSTLGMMLLVSATELLTLYVALELSAYGLFILIALNQNQKEGSEAGVKYLLFGAAASAVSLYGISLIYGVSGSTYLSEVAATGVHSLEPTYVAGFVLMISGFLFKLAVFPFHSWAPDAYEGGPHEAVAFVGTVSKVAALGVLIRAFALVVDNPGQLGYLVFVLCVVSMTIGNLAALVQKDLKRLLAYSTVAHAGYVLLGIVGLSEIGFTASIFYVFAYVVMAFAPLFVVMVLGARGDNPSIENLSGLYQRSPFLALVLLLGIFGLAGVPPTVGFAGKWFLFTAVMEAGYFGLVFLAAVNATVSLYYYLQMVRYAYLMPPEGQAPVSLGFGEKITGAVTMIAIVGLGFFPETLWAWAGAAARAVLLF